MTADVRTLIQAAQVAEGRGDPLEAASLLRRAAGLCEDAGRPARAAQLLRHAVRLSPDLAAKAWLEALDARLTPVDVPTRPGTSSTYVLEDEVSLDGLDLLDLDDAPQVVPTLDESVSGSGALGPTPGAGVSTIGASASANASGSPSEGPAQGRAERVFEPRGPSLAAQDANAWCSFCCRPTVEAGALVEGPTGAFVCAGCLQDALRLLGSARPAGSPAAAQPAVPSPPPSPTATPGAFPRRLTGSLPWEHARAPTPAELPMRRMATPPGEHPRVTPTGLQLAHPEEVELAAPGELLLAHHVETLVAVEDALVMGHLTVLLLGPHGSGRSTCLRTLGPRLGAEALWAPFDEVPEVDLWLLDDAHLLSAPEWRTLSRQLQQRPDVRLVLTAPLDTLPRTPALQVRTHAEAKVDVWSTAQLIEAAPGLPEGLAARVTRVVTVEHPDAQELTSLATSLITRLRPRVEDASTLAALLSRLALASGRGLHELLALIQRLPGDALGAVTKATRGRAMDAKSAAAQSKAAAARAAKAKASRTSRKGRR